MILTVERMEEFSPVGGMKAKMSFQGRVRKCMM